jgi:hypothetical protein
MRRTCEVYHWDGDDFVHCGEPAVDYAEVVYKEFYEEGFVKIWMCARHWDERQKGD